MNNNKTSNASKSDMRHLIRVGDRTATFMVPENRNLLVSMEQTQLNIIGVGCRGGGCGKCRIRVLEGGYDSKRMSRAWISEEEEAQGVVLACRIFARSDMLIVPYPPKLTPGYQVHTCD